MNARNIFLIITAACLLIGCGTPAQVKQLSVKQAEYFDAAIEAVVVQSEALILASERLAELARKEIDSASEENKKRFVTLVQGEITEETARRALDEVANTTETAAGAKARLDRDVDRIRQKTDELKIYLQKMKEVHMALDAYVQSEKAGERVLNDVLNQPSVSALLDSAGELIPKVQTGLNDITTLLGNLNNGEPSS